MSKVKERKPAAGDRIRSRILAAVRGEAWVIVPEKLELIDQIVLDRLQNGRLFEDRAEVVVVEPKAQEGGEDVPLWSTRPAGKNKQIAVLPVHGVLSKRMSFFERISGGTSTDAIAEAAAALMRDDTIAGVVGDFDTPGGAVAGTAAAAAALRDLAAAKPFYAVSNDSMYSGGYWLGSAARRIFVGSTAGVGSVGVITMHFDRSKQMDKLGVKPTIIAAGKHKAVGNEYAPLDDEGLAVIRERIASIYDTFVGDVAKHRGLAVERVRETIADGRIFTGRQAIELGAADEIGTLESVIAKLTGELSSATSRGVVLVNTGNTDAGGTTPAADAVNLKADGKETLEEAIKATSTIKENIADLKRDVDETAIRAEAGKAERERCQEIRACVKAAGVEEKLADEFIDADVSVDAVRTRLFDILKERNKAAGIGGQAATVPGASTPEQKQKDLEAKARKEYDAHRDVHEKTGVSFEAFLKTFAKEQAEDSTAG